MAASQGSFETHYPVSSGWNLTMLTDTGRSNLSSYAPLSECHDLLVSPHLHVDTRICRHLLPLEKVKR